MVIFRLNGKNLRKLLWTVLQLNMCYIFDTENPEFLYMTFFR
jgi:hypothetical protein